MDRKVEFKTHNWSDGIHRSSSGWLFAYFTKCVLKSEEEKGVAKEGRRELVQ